MFNLTVTLQPAEMKINPVISSFTYTLRCIPAWQRNGTLNPVACQYANGDKLSMLQGR